MNPTLVDPMYSFLNGAAFMGSLTCGLFFFRFWRRSRDRLFGIFGAAFVLLSVERLVFFVNGAHAEDQFRFYSLRLLAFLMILLGIWDKNRARAKESVYQAKAG